jgi:hypothetical protein
VKEFEEVNPEPPLASPKLSFSSIEDPDQIFEGEPKP